MKQSKAKTVKITLQLTIAIALLLTITTSSFALAASDLTLWHDYPAKVWQSDIFPIGNGQMGAMIYGGVAREEIQFNSDSLWTGDENPSGGYDSMGAYQNFGSVLISLAEETEPTQLNSPSGHKSWSDSESIEKSIDGDTNTKWCVEHKGKKVQWQMSFDKNDVQVVNKYAFTSANDAPNRDPKTWILEGSLNAKKWTTLHEGTNKRPFSQRRKKTTYRFKNSKAYKYYRFTFSENHGGIRYQLAEIELVGINPKTPDSPLTYRRSLDLSTAIHTVQYYRDGVKYQRESFISAVDQVLVSEMTASKKASYSGTITIKDAHNAKCLAKGNTLTVSGALDNDLQYEGQLLLKYTGGTVKAKDGKLIFNNCDSLQIFLACGTDYVLDYSKKFKAAHPHKTITSRIKNASKQRYRSIRQNHINDHQSLFNRVSLDLGSTPKAVSGLSLDKRIKAYATDPTDRDLEEMLFQYGRYLLIGSSRPSTLPANLQGLWNNSNTPPWHSDYHSNINLQMNYWLAEPANLADCHEPLINLTKEICEPSRQATQKAFGDLRGFTYRTSHNIFGGHGWQWNIPASAWYMQHLWEHYAFGQDKQYLKETLYPILKEVVTFWEDHLKELPDGTLVVPNGWSPEHGPREDGVAHDQQIVWDLFTNYIEAAQILDIDRGYQRKILEMKKNLLGPKIGKWGQLQEWVEDRDDPKDQHRHTSHLFAVYPGRQISINQTPEFANTAMISLKARGDSGDSRRSWTWPWRCALWARFHKGQECHRMIRGLLEYNMLNNLLATHPPLQLDGSFGITAGMCEMFLQSQTDALELLPALPEQWPDGSIKGLRARGGYEVGINWKDGKLSNATIKATVDGPCKLQASVPFKIANTPTITKGNQITFNAKAGKTYKLVTTK